GLARLRMTGEEPWHPHWQAVAQPAREAAVLRVDIGDGALAVGNHGAIGQAVDDGTRHGSRLVARGEAEEAGGERKEAEDADDRQKAQKEQDGVGRDTRRECREHHGRENEKAGEGDDAPKAGGAARTRNERAWVEILLERRWCHVRRQARTPGAVESAAPL